MEVANGGNTIKKCNRVGDFFKNPFLFKVLSEYHELLRGNTGKKIGKRKYFSVEFYDFLIEIFSDASKHRVFLQRIRNTILQEKPKHLEKISSEVKLEALLVFRELHKILSLDGDFEFDIQAYLDTPSFSLVQEAMQNKISVIGRDVEHLPIESDKSLYELLLNAVNHGCAITDDGRIVCVLGSVSEKVFNVTELTKGESMQVNQYGTLINNISEGGIMLQSMVGRSQIH